MNKLSLLVVAVVVLASAQAVEKPDVQLKFSSGDSTMGIYYTGNETVLQSGETDNHRPDYEVLTSVLGPNRMMWHNTFFHHSFVVRSSNLHFRAKVTVYKNEDENHLYPYAIEFKNLALENPAQHMELKHSNSGFLWIHPGESVKHRTDVNHDFTLRNVDRTPMFTIRLHHPLESDDL